MRFPPKILKPVNKHPLAVTALEYGIVAVVLGLSLITLFQDFGKTLTPLFKTLGASL